jgi:hypothetical protein
MCILSVWEVGGVHKAICQMPKVSEDKVLQQRVSEKCLGLSQALVCCCYSIIRRFHSYIITPWGKSIWLEVRQDIEERSTKEERLS